MALRELLLRVATEYQTATEGVFKEHPIGVLLRQTLPAAMRDAMGVDGEGLMIKGSAGQGVWASVPWAAVFEPAITETATRGYYPVYLFNVGAGQIHLSLNQGTTAVHREFGSRMRAVLIDRAAIMRLRVRDFAHTLSVQEIDLPDDGGLGGDYAAGHALGISYDITELPDEERLTADLLRTVACYRALIFRGGLDMDAPTSADRSAEAGSLDEERRYRMHRRIERNPKAAKAAKKFHGFVCQACNFDFSKRYGELGSDFIEAHHLKPISSLTEGTKVRYDVASDFAVLCANCHRMIHRLPNPADLAALVAAIR